MSSTTTKTSRLTLNGNLDIALVGKLKTRMLKAAERCVDVNLYAEKLDTIDTAALQLLYAFVQCVKANGKGVVWHQPSEALLNSASLLGLSQGLGLEQPVV